MFLALMTGTVGFAARTEAFDDRGADHSRREGQLADQKGLALAQRQSRFAAEGINPSHNNGKDTGNAA